MAGNITAAQAAAYNATLTPAKTAPVPTTTTTAPKTYSYVINGKPITLSAAQYATLSPTSQAALNAQYSPTAVTPTLATAPTASTTAGASTTTSVIDAWNKLSAAAKQNAVSTWNQ